jgi:sterol desaturase/sphingolipid hydroxylase (fatty acid hydroxylase superfamily)
MTLSSLDPTILAIPVFGITMLVEFLALRRRPGLKGYTLVDTAGSLAQGIGYLLSHAAWVLAVIAGYELLAPYALFDIEAAWWSWILVFVLDDLCFYWAHRFGHEVHLGWAAHHTHHSSQHYNLSTALRQSWTEQLFHPLFQLPLILLGFPMEMVFTSLAVSLLYQYWLHTELIDRMGWFGLVFNTPSHHRVHHGANPQYLDTNYAGILIVWDRLFGTFEPEVEPVRYGTTTGFDRQHPLVVAFHQWGVMLRQAATATTPRGRVMAVFGPPGWTEPKRTDPSPPRVPRAG